MEFYLVVLVAAVVYSNLKDPIIDFAYDFAHRRRMKYDPEYRRFIEYTETLGRDIKRFKSSLS